MKKFLKVFISIVATLAVAGYVGLFFVLLDGEHRAELQTASARLQEIKANQAAFRSVYTEYFPLARTCPESGQADCDELLRNAIDSNHSLRQVLSFNDTKWGRRPIYFIRLGDEYTIEKLFQSGKYLRESVDTPGERAVVKMLQDQESFLPYPQVTCCGGDDILPEFPILGWFLPSRLYLRDHYTEIEQILPVRDEDGQIMGAVVYLHGD